MKPLENWIKTRKLNPKNLELFKDILKEEKFTNQYIF
jgi:hypothetical protein